jgi:hypothetical protein
MPKYLYQGSYTLERVSQGQWKLHEQPQPSLRHQPVVPLHVVLQCCA